MREHLDLNDLQGLGPRAHRSIDGDRRTERSGRKLVVAAAAGERDSYNAAKLGQTDVEDVSEPRPEGPSATSRECCSAQSHILP